MRGVPLLKKPRKVLWAFLAFIPFRVCSAQGPPPEEIKRLATIAQTAEAQHDYSQAIAGYEKLLKLVPGSAELYSNLGVARHMSGDLEGARKDFEKALSLNSGLTVPKIFLGIEYQMLSRPDKAVPYLAKAVEENPRDILARKWLARSYYDTAEYAQAASQLRIALNPGSTTEEEPELLYLLGETYLKLSGLQTAELAKVSPDSYFVYLIRAEQQVANGALDNALVYFQVALQQKPDVPDIYLEISKIRGAKGEIQAALDECQKALSLNPDDPRANLYMAKLLASQDKLDAVTPFLHKLSALGFDQGPDFQALKDRVGRSISEPKRNGNEVTRADCGGLDQCRDLAVQLATQKQFEDSRLAWEKAGRFGPLSAEMLSSLAKAQFLTGRFNETVDSLKLAQTRDQLKSSDLVLLGKCFLKLGNAEAAVETLTQVSPSSEDYAEALYLLSRSYGEMAKVSFERLEAEAPNSHWVHLVTAEALAGQGETNKAIEEYQKALDLKPDARLINLALGDLYWKKFEDEEAFNYYLAELKVNPHSALANYALGHAYLELHQSARALPYLMQAIRLDNSLAEAHLDLGKLYMQEREFTKAVQALETYLRQSPNDKTAHYKLYQAFKALGLQAKAEQELKVFGQLDEVERHKPVEKAQRIRKLENSERPPQQ